MATRPKKEALDYVVPVRLNETLKKWVESQADRRMLSVSDIVREALIERKERVEHGRL